MIFVLILYFIVILLLLKTYFNYYIDLTSEKLSDTEQSDTSTSEMSTNKTAEVIDDHITKRFSIKKRVGSGAYGIVWKGVEKKTNEKVAIKKIWEAFRNEVDAQRTFREIMFLRIFRSHPNVVKLNSVHKSANHNDIYLCMEYMQTDLSHVIRKGTILKDVHKRLVTFQIVNALRYIHSGNVIHRDLKPNNILLDEKCRCKIGDFGMARTLPPAGDSLSCADFMMSDYVATRWYRAPECIIGCKSYTSSIDMWSLGCIIAEMFLGSPVFPGSSTFNQMQRVIATLPTATEEDLESMRSLGANVRYECLTQYKYKKTSIDEVLRDAPEDGRNLVKGLLTFNPKQRLTASDVRSHQYVSRFRHSYSDMVMRKFVELPLNDNKQFTVYNYRSKIYDFINNSEKSNQLPTKDAGSQTPGCADSPTLVVYSNYKYTPRSTGSLSILNTTSGSEISTGSSNKSRPKKSWILHSQQSNVSGKKVVFGSVENDPREERKRQTNAQGKTNKYEAKKTTTPEFAKSAIHSFEKDFISNTSQSIPGPNFIKVFASTRSNVKAKSASTQNQFFSFEQGKPIPCSLRDNEQDIEVSNKLATQKVYDDQKNEIRGLRLCKVFQPSSVAQIKSDNVEPVYRPNAQKSDQKTTNAPKIARPIETTQGLVVLSPKSQAMLDARIQYLEKEILKYNNEVRGIAEPKPDLPEKNQCELPEKFEEQAEHI